MAIWLNFKIEIEEKAQPNFVNYKNWSIKINKWGLSTIKSGFKI